MKKVLVITYSQSGQLDDIVGNLLKPLYKKFTIHYEKLKPIPGYPFPWPDMTFWDTMPESVKMIPAEMKPLQVDIHENFDLVIIGYPIWFLSPPIPVTTFLKSESAKELLNGKPVITVIGSRNMWVSAQENVKQLVADAGGNIVGNVALHDRNHNLPSVVTIVYWMMTGKKDSYLGIFPKPGVSDEDIKGAEKFGYPIIKALKNDSFSDLQNELIAINAVEIKPSVVSIEKKGKRIFKIWSGLILKKGGPRDIVRTGRLKMFKWYLLFVIFAVSPIATIIFYMTYPFFFFKINRNMDYYRSIKLK